MTEKRPLDHLSRRRALAGVAGVGIGLPVLAACGGDSPSTAGDPTGGASSSGGTATPSGGASSGGTASGLTATADIEVGGGAIFADEKVVVTQPSEGDFRGFSTTCTHQGCAVSKVTGEGIVCPCHGSVFSLDDGSPQAGPATAPLEEVALSVQDGRISLA